MLHEQTRQGGAKTFLDSPRSAGSNLNFHDGPAQPGCYWGIYDALLNEISTDFAPNGWSVGVGPLKEAPLTSGPYHGPYLYDVVQDVTVTAPLTASPGTYNVNYYYCGQLHKLDGTLTTNNFLTGVNTVFGNPNYYYSYDRDWRGVIGLVIYVCSDWTISSTDPRWEPSTKTLTLTYNSTQRIVPSAPLTFSLVPPAPPALAPAYYQGVPSNSHGSGFYDGGVYEGPFTGDGNPPPYNYIESQPYIGNRGTLKQGYKMLQLFAFSDTGGTIYPGNAYQVRFFYSDRTWGIPASATLTSETVNISPDARNYSFTQGRETQRIVADVYVGNVALADSDYIYQPQGQLYLLDKLILIHLVIIVPGLGTRPDAGDQMDMAQDHSSGHITIIKSVPAP